MEATEHSRFVGVTIEWKDNLGTEGQKLSPEALMISVTAPFEQVWDMHNSLNGLPFTKKVSSAAKRRGSMMVQRKRDAPSKPRGPRMIKVDDGSGVAIPALKMDSAVHDAEKPQQLSPKAHEMKELNSDSPGPHHGSSSDANSSPSGEQSHVPASPASDSSSPPSPSPASNGSPVVSPNRATPPLSPKDGKHHEKHEKHGSRALSPRDLVSEINLSKDEYFNWTMNIEPNIRLEPSLAVLTTRLCTFMGNYSYDLVTMTSPHNSRSYLFKLAFA